MLLDSDYRDRLQKKARKIQEQQASAIQSQRPPVQRYYRYLMSRPGSKDTLRKELCRMQDGFLQPFTSNGIEEVLQKLSKGEFSSEAVFMSFFHVVCKVCQYNGDSPPEPSQLLRMQRLLFGRRWVTICAHSTALLAYTLGLIQYDGVEKLEEEQLEEAAKLPKGRTLASQEKACNTTALFEGYLNENVIDRESFKAYFLKKAKLESIQAWQFHLKQCMTEIFDSHGWRYMESSVCLRERGCAHMWDTLNQCVFQGKGGKLPQRDWILSFSLYMGLTEDETEKLLRCCGYTALGLEPWEEGVRCLLQNPSQGMYEALDRREEMFGFLKKRNFNPPSAVFAAFPHLASQPAVGSERDLLARLLLDCCAEVRPTGDDAFYADFFSQNEILPGGGSEIPDYLAIFLPDCDSGSFSEYLRERLGYPRRYKIEPMGRKTDGYQQASDHVKDWCEGWCTPEKLPEGYQVMWRFPDSCGRDAAFRRRLLYSLLLYVLYTGHLPLNNWSFPAPFPSREGLPDKKILLFKASDEADACLSMARGMMEAFGVGCGSSDDYPAPAGGFMRERWEA